MDAEPVIGGAEEDENLHPPPLTNERELSSGSQNVGDEIREDELDDELISLVAPVDEVPGADEFRLSIELPSPAVVVEMNRMSRRMSRLSKAGVGLLPKVSVGDEEGDIVKFKVMQSEEKLDNLMDEEKTNNPTMDGEVFSSLSAGEIQEETPQGVATNQEQMDGLSPIKEEDEKSNLSESVEDSIVEEEEELTENQKVEDDLVITDTDEIETATLVAENNVEASPSQGDTDLITNTDDIETTILVAENNVEASLSQGDTDLITDTDDIETTILVAENNVETSQSQGDTDLPKDTVQQEKERSNSLEICDSNCQPQKITLGEPEKEQLKTAGIHILEIGQKLLTEMNFIENLLGKFGLFVPKENDGAKRRVSGTSASGHQSHYERGSYQITDQVGWQKQFTEESKLAAKIAQFGSGFESPHFSRTSFSLTPEIFTATTGPSMNQNNNYDLRKRLAELEMKFEGMCSKVDVCDKQVKEAYQTLCGALNKLTEEIQFLKGQISKESEVGTMLRTTMDDKISCFQEQILQLAKIIWEMKCEAKAQMHFGRME